MSKSELQVIVLKTPKSTPDQASEMDLDKIREDIAQYIRETIRLVCGSDAKHSVTWIKGDKTTAYKVCVEQRVLGKILGSKGNHINGLRTLIQAMCGSRGFRGVIDAPETFEYGSNTPKFLPR
ncbi:KH domain-containing protein [Bdellovibrio sp.]|uniref:KH domain-containing protein n=1 Tax=Bdellovibrio sp. TaxID=28201 RepID=UPI0039E2E24D